MKLAPALSMGLFFASTAIAANLEDVKFLTALVGDFDDHRAQYILFIKTASSVPAELTTLAVKVVTYTDDSYTTLLDNSDIDVTQLKSFATELPWYSRLEAEVDGSAGSTSTSESTSVSESQSSSTGSSGSGASIMALTGAFVGAVALLLL